SKILKKSVSFEPHDDPADDVIMLNNNLPNYVPDSVSPSPRPQKVFSFAFLLLHSVVSYSF
ncbi:hypothetical protein Q6247_26555, partial [Klebsiella pneumoniae]